MYDYNYKSEKDGRPNYDVILIFKILVLQHWSGLSDLEIERQMAERISFMSFLIFLTKSLILRPYGYSKSAWNNLEKIKMVWAELQRQLDAMGLQGYAWNDLHS